MNKTLIMIVIALVVNTFAVKQAQASFLFITQTMISLGITDKQTVQHNIKVYNSILGSIEKNINNRTFVLQNIKDLSHRLDTQMSLIGYDFSNLIAPELEYALMVAARAAKQNDLSTLKLNISFAKKQLAIISTSI